jgi:hypothetical protein
MDDSQQQLLLNHCGKTIDESYFDTTKEGSEDKDNFYEATLRCAETELHFGGPEEMDEWNNNNAQESQIVAVGGQLYAGLNFESIESAKQTITAFSGCPVRQSSTRNLKYVEFSCFRSGVYTKKTSNVISDENKRNSKSVKCGCKFCVRLKLTKCGSYEVYATVNTHNHDLYTPEELQQLPQN